MQIKQPEKKEGSIKIAVTLTAQEFDAVIERAYKKNAGKYSIDGFRKGKVPRGVIEKNYGEQTFFEDAINMAASDAYKKFLDDNKDIVPFTYPQIEVQKVSKEDGLALSIEMPLAPSVKLGQYKGLKVKKVVAEATDAEVDAELRKEQHKHVRYEKSANKAANGDMVNIDFKGFANGVAFEGGEAKGHNLELGSNSFIPGFEAQLVGTKAGDTKDVLVTFPKEYHAKNLAGKEAVFKCKVNEVKAKILPKLDDAFAKEASEFNTLAEFKAGLKKAILSAKEGQALMQTEQNVVDAIIAKSVFVISQIVVEEEANFMINDIAEKLMQQGATLKQYCDYMGTTVDQLRKSKVLEAEKVIKMRLVFREILAKEKLEAGEADIVKVIQKTNRTANLDDAAAKKYFDKMSEAKQGAVKNDALMQKLIEFLVVSNV